MDLRDYAGMLRRRLSLVAACVITMVVAAAVLSVVQDPEYSGSAAILVTQQDAGITILGYSQPQVSYQPDREVQTQVQVVQSRLIAQRAAVSIGSDVNPDYLLKQITASADANTNVIVIEARDSTPDGAARIANAFAEEYVSWSRESQRASIRAAADDVEQRVAETQRQVQSMEVEASTPGAGDAEQVRLDTARSLYAMFSEKLEELRIAEQLATGRASVLASATPDSSPVAPRPMRNGILGLAVGLFAGLIMAFVAEELDTRVRTAEDAAAIYGSPVLVSIPAEKVSKVDLGELTMTARPDSPTAEAYRMLRNSLRFLNLDNGLRTVLITSAVPSEGKSTVAANLATVLAQAGERVTLVVCDFRVQAAERYFNLDSEIGLSEVLVGKVKLADALRRPSVLGLQVLPAGSLPTNPSQLLGSPAMSQLLVQLRGSSDWVILDSAPVLATAEAAAVVPWVDGVLLVARIGVSKRDAIRAGREQLRSANARVLGLVAWGSVDSVVAHSYYGYSSR